MTKPIYHIKIIRLNFDTFTITQPHTTAYAGRAADTTEQTNPRTQCQRAQFLATSDGPNPPIICGTNTGYHMILEAQDSCNTLTFAWDNSDTQTWNIHISQFLCTDPHKAPAGCLQYFTGKLISCFPQVSLKALNHFPSIFKPWHLKCWKLTFIIVFAGTTGNIYSYNFQGGYHLANQVMR